MCFHLLPPVDKDHSKVFGDLGLFTTHDKSMVVAPVHLTAPEKLRPEELLKERHIGDTSVSQTQPRGGNHLQLIAHWLEHDVQEKCLQQDPCHLNMKLQQSSCRKFDVPTEQRTAN